jgi:gamma-D-glutamyl-L-lysine dipeptidyl-peptidase
MINNNPIINIYKKPSRYSKLSSQMLFGEEFKIISKKGHWYRVRTDFDNYPGYIKKFKFLKKLKPSHKVYKLKTRIFIRKNNKFVKTNNFLYFASKISMLDKDKNYIEYDNNKWIDKKDIKNINHYEKNFSKILKLFLNTKYLWGGKSSDGIDCSALIQIYFYYNGTFFHRDTIDQAKPLLTKLKKNIYNRKQLIFWRGHVAYCLNKNELIHAYGPRKKVLIMNIKKTIKEIKKKSKLSVRGVKKLNVK